MSYITNYQYYTNNGTIPQDTNWGSYQYVSLFDIVNNFMLMYVGNDKLVNNVDRYTLLFHAKRAVQELNYDALRNIKVLEIEMGDDLKLILPPDYVNYVRISMLRNGLLIPLVENRTVMSATAYLQDNDLEVVFDSNGQVVIADSKLDILRQNKELYTGPGAYNGSMGWCCDGDWFFGYRLGQRYGMNPEDSNINPKFSINKSSGIIDFSSGVENSFIIIEYVSDGMENGDETKITINKLAEEYLYSYLKWAVLNNKIGVQEYAIARVKKEKTATLRNTKIRLSNMHPSRLLMSLRGKDKWIK
tara:strand:- start:428 stop:1336 length:909 start_codon:yes stop_codon:yes gene_type:complete